MWFEMHWLDIKNYNVTMLNLWVLKAVSDSLCSSKQCFICFVSGRLMMKMRCCMEKQKFHFSNHLSSQNQTAVLWCRWLVRPLGELFSSTFTLSTLSPVWNLLNSGAVMNVLSVCLPVCTQVDVTYTGILLTVRTRDPLYCVNVCFSNLYLCYTRVIQKFPNCLPGAWTANGTALLCH